MVRGQVFCMSINLSLQNALCLLIQAKILIEVHLSCNDQHYTCMQSCDMNNLRSLCLNRENATCFNF